MSAEYQILIEEISNYLNNLDSSRLDQMVSSYSYQGFDPIMIVKQLRAKGVGMDLKEDISIMIIVFLTRGNKIATILKKTAEQSVVVLSDLHRVYNILNGSPKTNTDLTLARVASSFPVITMEICLKLTHLIRPGDSWLIANGITNLKNCLKCPGIFGLLRKDLNENDNGYKLIKSLLLIQHAESEVINSKNRAYQGKSLEQKLTDLLTYSRAAYDNGIVTANMRSKYTATIISCYRKKTVVFFPLRSSLSQLRNTTKYHQFSTTVT